MECPTAVVTLQLQIGNLQLEDNASLLRQICRLPSEYIFNSTTAFNFSRCSPWWHCFYWSLAPSPLPLMIAKQLFPWWEMKGGISIPLEFSGQVISLSAIKFIVCHTKNKGTLIFMQCEVSFVQKLERFKCPRESRNFRYYTLTLFLVRTVLCGDNVLFSWGRRQTVRF